MNVAIEGFKPGLAWLQPSFSPAWAGLARRLSPWYLRRALNISAVSVSGLPILTGLFRRLENDQLRFLIAFRHPHTDDGPLIFHLVSRLVPAQARAEGRPLVRPGHAWFIYGRDVPVWAGAGSAFILPRLGAVPWMHNTLDSRSVRQLRAYLLEGRAPLALAPEGQVVYSTDRIGPVDPGAARLALWCLEDLEKTGSSKEVLVVPVSTRYHYAHSGMAVFEKLFERMESECGLSGGRFIRPYQRVERLRDHLLERMDDLYRKTCRELWPKARSAGGQETIERIVESALRTAERALDIRPSGNSVQRVFEIRQAGLRRIYRADLPPRAAMSGLDRRLADRRALEAWLALRHMELVDLLEYFRFERFGEDTSLDRHIEAAQNLWDIVNRLEGGAIGGRTVVFRKRVEIGVGEPIGLREFRAERGASRRQVVADLTAELVRRFEQLI